MSIKIKVKDDSMEGIGEPEIPKTKVRLDIRKTLDGNFIIQDHPYIDIIISPSKKKILALSTIAMDDKVYYTQNKYFDFLYKRGVIDPSTVQAGNIYASMEAAIPDTQEKVDPVEVIIFSTALFMDKERPSFEYEKAMRKAQDDYLTDPTDQDSTELGEVPQKPRQGSIGTAAYSINKNYNIAYLGERKEKK
jgi:hypothetical protein